MKETEKVTLRSFRKSNEGKSLIAGLAVGFIALFFVIIFPALSTSVSAETKADEYLYTTSAQVTEPSTTAAPQKWEMAGKMESYIVDNEDEAIQIAKAIGPDVENVSWQQGEGGKYIVFITYEKTTYTYK